MVILKILKGTSVRAVNVRTLEKQLTSFWFTNHPSINRSINLKKILSICLFLRFVQMRTTGAGSSGKNWGGVFGTQRDSQRQQQRWRQEISERDLLRVEGEASCVHTITTMGFRLFHSLPQVRNFSLPLYKLSADPPLPATTVEDVGGALGPRIAVADAVNTVSDHGVASKLFQYKHCEVLPDVTPYD